MTERAEPNGDPVCDGDGGSRRCVRLVVDDDGRQHWELVSPGYQLSMMLQRVVVFTLTIVVIVMALRLYLRQQRRYQAF